MSPTIGYNVKHLLSSCTHHSCYKSPSSISSTDVDLLAPTRQPAHASSLSSDGDDNKNLHLTQLKIVENTYVDWIVKSRHLLFVNLYLTFYHYCILSTVFLVVIFHFRGQLQKKHKTRCALFNIFMCLCINPFRE